MFCPNCGKEISNDLAFCPNCGHPLKNEASAGTKKPGQQENTAACAQGKKRQVRFASDTVVLPDAYKPISMWGYFGYEILFSIPLVGFIILIVMSINAKNENVKNFARSYFCFTIVAIVLLVILLVALASAAGASAIGGMYY